MLFQTPSFLSCISFLRLRRPPSTFLDQLGTNVTPKSSTFESHKWKLAKITWHVLNFSSSSLLSLNEGVLHTLPFPPPPPAYCWCLPWALLSWCDSPCRRKPNMTKSRSSHLLAWRPELADCSWSEWWLGAAFSCKTYGLRFGVGYFSAWDSLKYLLYICLLQPLW